MNFQLHNTRLIVEKMFFFPGLFVVLLYETTFFNLGGKFAVALYGNGFVCGHSSHEGSASD